MLACDMSLADMSKSCKSATYLSFQNSPTQNKSAVSLSWSF